MEKEDLYLMIGELYVKWRLAQDELQKRDEKIEQLESERAEPDEQ